MGLITAVGLAPLVGLAAVPLVGLGPSALVGARPFGLAYALVLAVRSGGERRRPHERRSRESHERSESYERSEPYCVVRALSNGTAACDRLGSAAPSTRRFAVSTRTAAAYP